MVSSTDIPNAILNTKIVEGFIGTPKNPIRPAVMSNGNKLGISDTKIILKLLNIQAINNAIKKIAKERESKRLLTKYFVPFSNTKAFPVMETL